MDRGESRRENHQKGVTGEELAADFLRAQGYEILEKNYRFHRNEIDIIAREGGYLVFVEVKYRLSMEHGYGFEAVDGRKQACLRRVAESYLLKTHRDPYQTPCRFDIVSIDAGEIRLYRNAF